MGTPVSFYWIRTCHKEYHVFSVQATDDQRSYPGIDIFVIVYLYKMSPLSISFAYRENNDTIMLLLTEEAVCQCHRLAPLANSTFVSN